MISFVFCLVSVGGGNASADKYIQPPAFHNKQSLTNTRRRTRSICLRGSQDNLIGDTMISPKDQEALCGANSQFFKAARGGKPDDNDDDQPKYISTNTWPRSRRGRELKKRAARPYIHGVEIRRLDHSHVLSGQLGLFAAKNFHQFDILGEYTGEVFDADDGGEYATYLEDRKSKYPLGVDAKNEGNECRYINHYKGIADGPNVVFSIAYLEELPRVMVVCTKDIAAGEEILVKYSDEYVNEYIGEIE